MEPRPLPGAAPPEPRRSVHDDAPEIAEIDPQASLASFGAEERGESGSAFAPTAPPARAAAPAAPASGGARPPVTGRGWQDWVVLARQHPPVLLAAAAVTVCTIALLAALLVGPAGSSAAETGMLQVRSDPPGAPVAVNGRPEGVTPLELQLAAGTYELQVGATPAGRKLTVAIAAGATATHHVHMAAVAPPVEPDSGALQITTSPAGARVSLDGEDKGKTPLVISNLEPGEHRLTVAGPGRTVEQVVAVRAGSTTAVVVPLGTSGRTEPAAGAGGWLQVRSPIDVQLLEDGRLLGSSRMDRVMLTAGRHTIDVRNEETGFSERREVTIPAGRTSTLSIAVPQSAVSVNALPWAEVWIGGRRVGETPIGEWSLPIGRHTIVLRHPELGERQVETVVRVNEISRVSVDLRAPGPGTGGAR